METNDAIEVMRITKDGITVNPNVEVDDAANAVLNAISDKIKVLVKKAVEEEREACARVCEKEKEPFSGFDKESYAGLRALNFAAESIRARK